MPLYAGPPTSSSSSPSSASRSAQIPLRRPSFSPNNTTSGAGLSSGGHARVPSSSSVSGAVGGTGRESRGVRSAWVVLGRKGRGFPKDLKAESKEEMEEDDWVTVGLERNIQAQVFALANALGIPPFPNLCLEAQVNGIRARIAGEEMWSTLFHQFLFPTASAPPPTSSFTPLPIVALLELRLLPASAVVTPPRHVLESERGNGEEASSRAREAWKGGVRKLSLLAGREGPWSEGSALNETVHRWKSLAMPPLPPTIPEPQQPLESFSDSIDATDPSPPSPYDPASYSYSVSSFGPPSPLKTPESGWASPAWNVAVSIGVAEMCVGSVCMTPLTATSWGPPSATSQDYQLHIGLSPRSVVATPDIGHRAEGSRPATPATATSWGAPSPPLDWEVSSPTERVVTPSIGERVALTPLGLHGRGWEGRLNAYDMQSFLDLGSPSEEGKSSKLSSARFDDASGSESPPLPPHSALLAPSSPPPSPATNRRSIRIDTSPRSAILPLTPPQTLESPERLTSLSPFPSPSPGLVSRRKAAPAPIIVPVSNPVPGLVVEKRKTLGPVHHTMATGPKLVKKVEQPPLPAGAVEVVRDFKSSSRQSSLELKDAELRDTRKLVEPSRPTGRPRSKTISSRAAIAISSSNASALPAATIPPVTRPAPMQIMLDETIRYPFSNGIYPSAIASSSFSRVPRCKPLASIRILLSQAIVYPFPDGIYPAVKKSLVENGELSGALEGLDRVKAAGGKGAGLFRFGFPFYIELDSAAPSSLASTPPLPLLEAIKILLSSTSYPITSSSLYPPPSLRSIRILRVQHCYPISSAMLYPTPIPRPLRILDSSTSSYPITSENLYPTSLPRSIRILGACSSRQVRSEDLYPPVVALSSAHRSSSKLFSGLRIMLSSTIAYPFVTGIYPPASRPISVENGKLSGALDGLDRVEDSGIATVPLGRSGYPFYIELGSSEATPLAQTFASLPFSIRTVDAPLSYPIISSIIYPLPLSRSLKILARNASYPLTSLDLYPLPLSRSLRILITSPVYPLTSEQLYPTPISRSIRILSGKQTYPLASSMLYPPVALLPLSPRPAKRSPTTSRNQSQLQINTLQMPRKAATPRRARKSHLMLHLEVVRTLLLSPLPTPTAPQTPDIVPAHNAVPASQHIPIRPPPYSIQGRTPSFARVSSHLPTSRAISSYGPTPPVPHVPSPRPISRSMSTRRPPALENVLERATLTRSVSHTQETASSARSGGGVGNRTSMARGGGPAGPPPSVPLPEVPRETTTSGGRRQSLLVSQRMSQLMAGGGTMTATSGGTTSRPSNNNSPRPPPARPQSRWI